MGDVITITVMMIVMGNRLRRFSLNLSSRKERNKEAAFVLVIFLTLIARVGASCGVAKQEAG